MEHSIYVLIDKKTNEIRYVGQTVKQLSIRLNGHISKAKNSGNKTTHKNTWIKSLLKENLKPIIKLIDVVDENDWKEIEKNYIFSFQEKGCDLLNISEGGDSGSMPGKKEFGVLRKIIING